MKPGNSAVTEEASAAFSEDSTSNFLPTDKNYRLTGEMPEEEETAAAGNDEEIETETAADQAGEKEGASHSPESDTAAASEAANAQKSGRAHTKTPETTENRFQKLSRENKEYRERLQRLEAAEKERTQASRPAAAAAESTSAAKADPEPQIDDVDAKGKPKYATYGDYMKDVRAWDRREAVREADKSRAKESQERQKTDDEKTIERTVNQRVTAIRKANADYDDVVKGALEVKDELGREAFFYTKGSAIDGFFLDSERGHDVMYAIAKNFDQHKHIFARDAQGRYLYNPVRQVRELTRIESSLPEKGKAAAAATSAKPVTQAPPPPHRVSGQGNVNKDAVETAVEEGDSEAYIRIENAKALARRKKGK